MTEREYRAAEGVSRSQLWRLHEGSPEKFKYAEEHPEDPTPALIFGQMVHKMVLEPETFNEEFAVAPEVDRRTKEGKAAWALFNEMNEGKTIVKAEDYDTACAMRNALIGNDLVTKLLSGDHEVPLFWTDVLTGETCKVRLDCYTSMKNRSIIVDYKTTADASTEAFMRSAINYGYDFQAAMYLEGVRKAVGADKDAIFVFIAQEKEPPYALNILAADDAFLRRGFDIFRTLLGVYHDCKETGNFYGYLGKENQINVLGLPAWLAEEKE